MAIDRFMHIAREVAQESPDPHTKVGAVVVDRFCSVVLSFGCNTFPDGVRADLPDRLVRPAKYSWLEHAERRAIFLAARRGVELDGASIFVSGGFPCPDCARAIIQAGIGRVLAESRGVDLCRWESTYEISRRMFDEADVYFLRH
jgi:dCMP deaminase